MLSKTEKEKPNNSNSRVFLTISDIIMLIRFKIRIKTGENKVKSLYFREQHLNSFSAI